MSGRRWSIGAQGLTNEALGELYEAHARSILVFLTRRTFDAEIALDLLGETFAQAVTGRRRFRGKDEAAAKAWLYAIARHQLSNYFKRGAVERRGLRRLRVEPPSAPEAELLRVEELAGLEDTRPAIAAGLAQLSHDRSEAIRLRVIEELPYPVIAERLGVDEQTVRARVSRGLRALSEALETAMPEGMTSA